VCVCGERKLAWRDDLESGRSTGCSSRRCIVRAQVVEELMPEVAKLLRGPEGERINVALQARLQRWLVEARQADRDDGWQVNAGRAPARSEGVESESDGEEDEGEGDASRF
jgi:hypothetical protein